MKITWYRIVDWPPPGCPETDDFWVRRSGGGISTAFKQSTQDIGWRHWAPKPIEEFLEPVIPQPAPEMEITGNVVVGNSAIGSNS